MPSPNWLPVVSIIVPTITTLAAAVIQPIVAARMNQPQTNPEPKNPKNLIQISSGRFTHASTSSWLPLSSIFISICLLPYEVTHAKPLTAQWVFIISVVVSSIFCNLVLMSVSALSRVTGKIIDLDHRRDGTTEHMLGVEGVLIDRVTQLEQQVAKSKEQPQRS